MVATIAAGRAVGNDTVAQVQRAVIGDPAAVTAGLVAAEGAVVDRQRSLVVDPAALAAGLVAAEGAVVDRQRAIVGDPAALAVGLVAVEGAVVDRQDAGIVDSTTRVEIVTAGPVAAEDAGVDHEYALVDDTAAIVGQAVDHSQGTERDHAGSLDGEDPAGVIAAKLQAGGVGVGNGDGSGDSQFGRGQGEGLTGQPGGKVNGPAVADIGDGLAQAARPAVVGVLHGDGIGAEDVKCGCRAAILERAAKKGGVGNHVERVAGVGGGEAQGERRTGGQSTRPGNRAAGLHQAAAGLLQPLPKSQAGGQGIGQAEVSRRRTPGVRQNDRVGNDAVIRTHCRQGRQIWSSRDWPCLQLPQCRSASLAAG